MAEDFNKEIDRDLEKLIDNQDLLDDEEEVESSDDTPQCAICGDSGQIEHGYWDEDSDDFIVTKYSICECSQD